MLRLYFTLGLYTYICMHVSSSTTYKLFTLYLHRDCCKGSSRLSLTLVFVLFRRVCQREPQLYYETNNRVAGHSALWYKLTAVLPLV